MNRALFLQRDDRGSKLDEAHRFCWSLRACALTVSTAEAGDRALLRRGCVVWIAQDLTGEPVEKASP